MKRLITLLAITLLISSCGFQPKGELPQLQTQLSPMTIRGLGVANPYRRILESRLAVAGVSLTSDSDAATLLQLHRIKNNRQVLSVDSRNKTVEYEITATVEFSLTSSDGKILVSRQTMTARHILFNPGTDLLGRTQEETLLRRDMYEDLSNRLITRLQYQIK